MGVDKSYGSGKPRSAANSAARRRVAAGQMTKSKKGVGAKIASANAKRSASPLGQLADTVLGFALPVGKLQAASKALRAAGRLDEAYSVAARVEAKLGGRELPKNIALAKKMFTGMSDSYNPKTASKVLQGGIQRENSLKVFPRESYGKLRSIPNLNPENARRAAKSFGQAASGERGLARSLRNSPGERNQSMNLFKDSLKNQRAGKAISKYKTPKGGR